MRNTTAYPTTSRPHLLVAYPVPTNEALTTESQRYNCFVEKGGNSIPQHACPEVKGSNSSTGRSLRWARNLFRGEILTTGRFHKKKNGRIIP